ncbi:MAG: PEP-CTERM sorting domain-containing protein [Bacilli bacterium]
MTATQVPEVSTVASVFGIMALGFALIRRRK